MIVDIDEAGSKNQFTGVDNSIRCAVRKRANGGDPVAPNADVHPAQGARVVGDLSVADHQRIRLSVHKQYGNQTHARHAAPGTTAGQIEVERNPHVRLRTILADRQRHLLARSRRDKTALDIDAAKGLR